MRKWALLALVIAACGDNHVLGSDGGIDASTDAGLDASIDAQTDATIDAQPDARVPFCGDGTIDPGEDCDDGTRGLSADGCSSTCKVETETWTQVSASVVIPPRAFHFAATFDTDRGVVVRFGGNLLEPGDPSDTWESDGNTWTPISSTTHPATVIDGTLVYDPVRHASVYFGGASDETWQWDGAAWTQLFPTHSPPTGVVAAAFDDGREVIVAHTVAFGTIGGTWEWDGTDWSQRATTGPVSGNHDALVYDPQLQRVLFAGGDGSDKNLWAWDGNTWAHQPSLDPPALGLGVIAAYDRVRHRAVFVDESSAGHPDVVHEWDGTTWFEIDAATTFPRAVDSGTTLVGTPLGVSFVSQQPVWTWDGATWTIPQPTGGPLPRALAAIAYDPIRRHAVMFGGGGPEETFGDTWEWDGVAWTQMHPAHTPSPRYNVAITYDVERQRIVLAGGMDGFGVPGNQWQDTWEWDGTDWSPIATVHVPIGGSDGMAYDRHAGREVLVSGTQQAPTTFALDATDWHDLAPSTGPTHAIIFTPAYDEIRQVIVEVAAGETWEWNGTAWADRGGAPAATWTAPLVYDPDRRHVVFFAEDTVWEWDGSVWSQLAAPPSPKRFGASLAFDSARTAILVFGGETAGTGTPLAYLGDTWIHTWRSATPLEQCDGTDADGDGLVDCADPDCWWSCTPTCPPLSSCP